ncbi:metallophosphoesterase, partial [bacterium]
THINCHAFLEKADGWNGRVPHHHFNCGTVSGSWWSGAPDEVGIPRTTMRDGTPNGYAFLNVTKNDYTIDWRSARKSPNYQMAVLAPAQIEAAKVKETPLQVNVFNGSPKTKVETRIGNGTWSKMERVSTLDPGYVALKAMEDSIPAFAKDVPKGTKTPWLSLPAIEETPHIWQLQLPTLPAGAHWIHVRATDHWNRVYEDKRLIQVV